MQARPLGVRDVLKRAISHHRVSGMSKRAGYTREELFPTQLSVGVKAGVGIAVTTVREHMVLHPQHHCVHLDVVNAHNTFERQRAMEATAASDDPEIASVVQQQWAESRSELQAYSGGRPLEGVTSKNGGQQGGPLLNLQFGYVLKEAQRKLREAITAGGAGDGETKFIADDGYVAADPACGAVPSPRSVQGGPGDCRA